MDKSRKEQLLKKYDKLIQKFSLDKDMYHDLYIELWCALDRYDESKGASITTFLFNICKRQHATLVKRYARQHRPTMEIYPDDIVTYDDIGRFPNKDALDWILIKRKLNPLELLILIAIALHNISVSKISLITKIPDEKIEEFLRRNLNGATTI